MWKPSSEAWPIGAGFLDAKTFQHEDMNTNFEGLIEIHGNQLEDRNYWPWIMNKQSLMREMYGRGRLEARTAGVFISNSAFAVIHFWGLCIQSAAPSIYCQESKALGILRSIGLRPSSIKAKFAPS